MANRWGPSADTLAVARKLNALPEKFGDWQLRSSGKLDEESVRELQPFGYLVRTYGNNTVGLVSVTLLLGPPGPTSVHTPEVCMNSRNYQSQGKRQRAAIHRADGPDDELWTLDYKADNIRGDLLRMYFGWSGGEHWSATDDPRFFFAGRPYLYKIQLSCDLPAASPPSSDACHKFLEDFLPVLRKCMAEPSRK
jgi:hypothetical protein